MPVERQRIGSVLEYPVSAVARIELEVIIEQIKGLNAGIAKIDKQLSDKGKDLDGHEGITSIKGIGDKGGAVLLSVIGDINNFEDEKKLAAYFGIVPRVSNSNETNHQGRITKRGSKLGRTTLSAMHADSNPVLQLSAGVLRETESEEGFRQGNHCNSQETTGHYLPDIEEQVGI